MPICILIKQNKREVNMYDLRIVLANLDQQNKKL